MAIKIGNAQTRVVCNSKYHQRPACRLTAHSVLAVFKDPILYSQLSIPMCPLTTHLMHRDW